MVKNKFFELWYEGLNVKQWFRMLIHLRILIKIR